MNRTKIEWNGFLERVVKRERLNQESCAWIFAEKPFQENTVWHIIECKNIGLKGLTLKESFAPDKRDFDRIKRIARNKQLTRIGNVHTHVVLGYDFDEAHAQSKPSQTDLSYAKRYNDIIRGIIVVIFDKETEKDGTIYHISWHDQYGNFLEVEAKS